MGRGILAAAAAAAVDAAGWGGHVRLEDLCCHLCMLWSVVWCLFLKKQQKPKDNGCIAWKWVLRAFGLRVSA
jgi:hypothetical protein